MAFGSGETELPRAGLVVVGPGPDEPYIVLNGESRVVEPISAVLSIGTHPTRPPPEWEAPTEPLSIGQGDWQMSCPLNLSGDLPLRRGT